MPTIEEIVQQAHASLLKRGGWSSDCRSCSTKDPRLRGPLLRDPILALALAGTVHTDLSAVSADKYKHLAEAYASQDDDP
jgi:hypothetical protein